MKIFRLLAAIIILGAIAAAAVAYWFYSSLNTPVEHTKANEYIVIERGSTPTQIVAKLGDSGIVKSELPLMLYLRTLGDASKLQAGEYRFASPISPLQVLQE